MKYKVNLRKIFALIVSVALVISVFAVLVVSADDETGMTNQEYYASQSYLIAKYKDGKISYSEFQQQSQAVTDEFVSKNTVGGVLQSGALNASNTFNAVSQKIGDTVQKYGDSARDYLSSIVSNFFDDYTVLNDKPTTDLNGSGALFEWYNPSGYLMKRAYCEYIIRDSSGDFRCYGDIRDINYNPNGTIQSEKKYPYGGTGKYYSWTSMLEYQKFYGDVRYEDGTQAETDDEAIPVIGETDGTQVTPDMLNPDGTVTIDGTTYYPKDFIDWDKFKDPAIIDLLNQILNKIDDIDVIEPDTTKDLVDSITDSVDISVSEELSDYMMPTGISSVFPFCLPFDLYRGIRLLSVKPVAPVLEIPFEVPEFGLFKGYKTTLTIEFEKYDKYFSVFRWGIYFIFALGLVFISTKIVKGAGA